MYTKKIKRENSIRQYVITLHNICSFTCIETWKAMSYIFSHIIGTLHGTTIQLCAMVKPLDLFPSHGHTFMQCLSQITLFVKVNTCKRGKPQGLQVEHNHPSYGPWILEPIWSPLWSCSIHHHSHFKSPLHQFSWMGLFGDLAQQI